MRSLIFAAAVFLPNLAWALCPPGQFDAFDNFGNKICKSFGSGATQSIQRGGQGNVGGCPAGTQPWADEFGNKTCRSIETGQQFYDTSKGCPIGTHPGFDTFGKPVCTRF